MSKLGTDFRPVTSRLASLDFARFIAALIVFSGHTLYFSTFISSSKHTTLLLSPIRTGATAVLFFFSLSGFVLVNQTSKERPGARWLLSRYVRLMPVYWVAYLLPFIGLIALGETPTNPTGFIFGITGTQSLSTAHLLEVNGPLWSLSVELILSYLFLILWHIRNSPFLIIATFALLLLNLMGLHTSPIAQGAPFFAIGMLAARHAKLEFLHTRKYQRIFLILVTILYLATANIIAQTENTVPSMAIRMIGIYILLMILTLNQFGIKTQRIFIYLGKRSYCFYAIHAPIIFFFLKFMRPYNWVQFSTYLFCVLFCTAVATELLFRWVEQPAIRLSQIIRKGKKWERQSN
jgi:peptidoglycan/LPS O-acetylase OafA/YrhL